MQKVLDYKIQARRSYSCKIIKPSIDVLRERNYKIINKSLSAFTSWKNFLANIFIKAVEEIKFSNNVDLWRKQDLHKLHLKEKDCFRWICIYDRKKGLKLYLRRGLKIKLQNWFQLEIDYLKDMDPNCPYTKTSLDLPYVKLKLVL